VPPYLHLAVPFGTARCWHHSFAKGTFYIIQNEGGGPGGEGRGCISEQIDSELLRKKEKELDRERKSQQNRVCVY